MKKIEYKKIIIFDFDGVIAHSYSVAFEVAQLMDANWTIENHLKLFEGNITNYKPSKGVKEIDFDKEVFKRIKRYDLRIYVKEVLEKLAKKHTLIIVSSTSDYILEYFLKGHKIYDLFDCILDVNIEKNKTKKFQMIFDKYKCMSEDCLFVTDTLGDILEANILDVPTIAILDGFHNFETLKKGNPIAIIRHFREIFRYSCYLK